MRKEESVTGDQEQDPTTGKDSTTGKKETGPKRFNYPELIKALRANAVPIKTEDDSIQH